MDSDDELKLLSDNRHLCSRTPDACTSKYPSEALQDLHDIICGRDADSSWEIV